MTRTPIRDLSFPASEEPLELFETHPYAVGPIYLRDGAGRPCETVEAPAFLSARTTDPDTSVAAAQSVNQDATERAIVEALRAHPRGLTADEIVATFPPTVNPPTIKSSLARVHKSGRCEDSGATRPSLRGRASIVWRAVG